MPRQSASCKILAFNNLQWRSDPQTAGLLPFWRVLTESLRLVELRCRMSLLPLLRRSKFIARLPFVRGIRIIVDIDSGRLLIWKILGGGSCLSIPGPVKVRQQAL